MVRSIGAWWHRHLEDFQGLGLRVCCAFKSKQILSQRRMVCVLFVWFDNRDHNTRGYKSGNIINMSVCVISFHSIVKPNNLLNPEPVTKAFLNFNSVQGGIPIWIQEALFRGQKCSFAIRV
jgi:hypothetical protein